MILLDEMRMVEWYGDAIRSDVFPSNSSAARTLFVRDTFYFLGRNGLTILLFGIDRTNEIRGRCPL
jgi:hypothetical protein